MNLRRATPLGELLAGLADGSLPDAHRERALAHLTHCCGCRAEVAALRSLRGRLLGLREEQVAPPAGLAHRLMALSGGHLPTHDPDRVPTWAEAGGHHETGPRRSGVLPVAGAAGAVVAAGVVAVLLVSSSTPSRDRPVLRPRLDPATGLVQVDVPSPPAAPLPQPIGAGPR
ncbi:MAG: putative transrane anti-sigma factor [Frankiales bacterium]|nr:putative transrane anti-sigma factor [Frankiales bacterium]